MTAEPLAAVDDVKAILGLSELDEARVLSLVSSASAAFRSATRQQVTAVDNDIVVLDGSGGWALTLPEQPVTAVASVLVDGKAVTDVEWSSNGVLRGSWPVRYRSVVVTYSHGYAPVPADVVEAVAERAAVAYLHGQSVGLVQQAKGPFSKTFNVGSTQKWSDTVALYRRRG